MSLLDEFADYELVCDSGYGTRMKVKDIGLLIFDDVLSPLSQTRATLHKNHPLFSAHYIVIGLEVFDYVIPSNSCYHKGTPDFERLFEKFLIERILK